MRTYKLFRIRDGDLYPLYVEHDRKLPTGVWLDAHVGELYDGSHVRSRNGPLALRPGWHSTDVPFTDWIGKRGPDGKLYQRQDTVWAECDVDGERIDISDRRGLRCIPDGWYFFRTNPKQAHPWVISRRIRINRILTHREVEEICGKHGIRAQPMAAG